MPAVAPPPLLIRIGADVTDALERLDAEAERLRVDLAQIEAGRSRLKAVLDVIAGASASNDARPKLTRPPGRKQTHATRVLASLEVHGGTATVAQIVRDTGLSSGQVSPALNDLKHEGRVKSNRQPGQRSGTWSRVKLRAVETSSAAQSDESSERSAA